MADGDDFSLFVQEGLTGIAVENIQDVDALVGSGDHDDGGLAGWLLALDVGTTGLPEPRFGPPA